MPRTIIDHRKYISPSAGRSNVVNGLRTRDKWTNNRLIPYSRKDQRQFHIGIKKPSRRPICDLLTETKASQAKTRSDRTLPELKSSTLCLLRRQIADRVEAESLAQNKNSLLDQRDDLESTRPADLIIGSGETELLTKLEKIVGKTILISQTSDFDDDVSIGQVNLDFSDDENIDLHVGFNGEWGTFSAEADADIQIWIINP